MKHVLRMQNVIEHSNSSVPVNKNDIYFLILASILSNESDGRLYVYSLSVSVRKNLGGALSPTSASLVNNQWPLWK